MNPKFKIKMKKIAIKIKRGLKKNLPSPVLAFVQNIRNRNIIKKFKNNNIKNNFNKIYNENLWTHKYSKSGYGSQGNFLNFSVKIIKKNKYINNKSVCSIGCGDFNFGKKIYKISKNYIGIDIVENLINYNKKKFSSKKVKFKCLDAVRDEIPRANVYIIRQVFQHLKNENIQKILLKIIKKNPSFIIVFEDVPKTKFKPNIDLPINGFLTRHYINSGIDLKEDPFNFNFKKVGEYLDPRKKIDSKLVCYVYEKKST